MGGSVYGSRARDSGRECGVEELKWAVAGRLALILGPERKQVRRRISGKHARHVQRTSDSRKRGAKQRDGCSTGGLSRGDTLGLSRRACIYHARNSRTGEPGLSLPQVTIRRRFCASQVATHGRLENGGFQADIHHRSHLPRGDQCIRQNRRHRERHRVAPHCAAHASNHS